MGRQWFYRIGGAERGPVTVTELKALAAGGALTPESPVRPDGASAWTPAGRVKGLFPDAPDSVAAAADAVTRTAGRVKKVARAASEVSDAVLGVAEAGDKVGRAASAVAGIFGLGSGVVGGVGDFLRPLGRLNAGVAVAAVVGAGVLFALARVKGSVRLRLAGVAALAVAGGFALWAALGAAGRDDRGFLASHVEPVERLQEKVLPPKEPPKVEPPTKVEPPPPPAVPTRKAEPVVIPPPPPPRPSPPPPVPVSTFSFRGPAALAELNLKDTRHRIRPNGGGLEILKAPDLKTPHGTIRTRAEYAGPIEARFEVFAQEDACYDVYLGVYNCCYLRWGIYGNTRTVVHVGGRDVEVPHPRIVPNRLHVVTLSVDADRRAEVRIDGARVLEQAIAPRAELRGPVYLLQGGFGHYVVQALTITARRAGESP